MQRSDRPARSRRSGSLTAAALAALALTATVSPLALTATSSVAIAEAAQDLGLVITVDQAVALIGQPGVSSSTSGRGSTTTPATFPGRSACPGSG